MKNRVEILLRADTGKPLGDHWHNLDEIILVAEVRVETLQLMRRYKILNIFKIRASTGYSISERERSQRQIQGFCRRMGKGGEEEKDFM